MIERRREQPDDMIAFVQQVPLSRCHGLSRPVSRSDLGDDGPGLRKRIDARLLIHAAPERRAVIEEATQIPLTIPAGLVYRVSKRCRLSTPLCSELLSGIPLLHHLGKGRQDRAKKPSKPNTLAMSFYPNAVHPVVPITRAKQGEAVRSKARCVLYRAPAMVPQRRRLRGNRWDEEPFLLAGGERCTIQIRYFLIEDRRVSRYLDVLCHRVRQPKQVIGTTGAHAQTSFRMPPMLDITFGELARSRGENMGTCHFWN